MRSKAIAASVTVRARGPATSNPDASGQIPLEGRASWVGLKPTVPL
jgi:hypothetical protein